MIPKENTSETCETITLVLLALKIYGAMYPGVPHFS